MANAVIEPSPIIRDRRDFAALCNYYELREAIEIGVDRGGFAFDFLQSWRGRTMWLIDDYLPYPGMQWGREVDKIFAAVRLSKFGDRVRFVCSSSVDVNKRFVEQNRMGNFGFIHIDADHDYDKVKQDIDLWWPMIKSGGILAGHDLHESLPGVVQAVTEFAVKAGLVIYVTCEEHINRSWYIRK